MTQTNHIHELVLFEKKKKDLSLLQIRLYKLLESKGPLDRTSICEELDLAWTTAFDNLNILLEDHHLVEKFKKHTGKIGHPPVYWKIRGGDT